MTTFVGNRRSSYDENESESSGGSVAASSTQDAESPPILILKTFSKTRNDDASHPLQECIDWARQRGVQRGQSFPMLIRVRLSLNAKKSYVCREYIAHYIRDFLLDQPTSASPRHYDEVIVADAPCKCYCDFEVEFTDEWARKRKHASLAALLQHCGAATIEELRRALDASAERLSEQIAAHHHNRGQVAVAPFVTVAHKASKWSLHVVFVDSLWAHSRHVGAFVSRLVRESADPLVPLYVDTQVYGRNHSMRMYRSSKPAEPEREFLRQHETPATRVDRHALLDSLITAFRVGDDDYVTSVYLQAGAGGRSWEELGLPTPLTDRDCQQQQARSVISRPLSSTQTRSVGVDESVAAAIRECFQPYTISKVTAYGEYGYVTANIRELYCAIAGREHTKTPHSYIVVDLLKRRWRLACFSRECAVHRLWQRLPESMTAVCEQYRREWPLAECFESLELPGPGQPTAYELRSYAHRRMVALVAVHRLRDVSQSADEHATARRALAFYPESNSGADWDYLCVIGAEATLRVRQHWLIAQHVLALLSLRSLPMRAALLHCEQLLADHKKMANSARAVYYDVWDRCGAVDILCAREPLLAEFANYLFDLWQEMSVDDGEDIVLREYCFGLGEAVPDNGVPAIESSAGSPLTRLAYSVTITHDGALEEAIEFTARRLQTAIAGTMAVTHGAALESRLDCHITLLSANSMSLLFPDIAVVNNAPLPSLAELRRVAECPTLSAVAQSGALQNSGQRFRTFTLAGDSDARLVELEPSASLPSLRPSMRQWRRFLEFHERVQLRATSKGEKVHKALRSPWGRANRTGEIYSMKAVVIEATYTIFFCIDPFTWYVRSIDAPGCLVCENGDVFDDAEN